MRAHPLSTGATSTAAVRTAALSKRFGTGSGR